MQDWLTRPIPLQGSVWFPGQEPPRLEAIAAFDADGIERGLAAWQDGRWNAVVRHPEWGDIRVSGMARPPNIAAAYAGLLPMTPPERAAIEAAGAVVVVDLPAGAGAPAGTSALRRRKAMLRLLQAIGGTAAVGVVDHTAQRVWTPYALAEEMRHDAPLDLSTAIAFHTVQPEPPAEILWRHSHGLAALGGVDFHVAGPAAGWAFEGADEVLGALAGRILDGSAPADGTGFTVIEGTEACLAPVADVLARGQGPAADFLRREIAGDEAHAGVTVVLCEPMGRGGLGGLFGRAPRPRPLAGLRTRRESPTIEYGAAMTALMAERARATYHTLRGLRDEFARFDFPVGVKLAFESKRGGSEHLWFRALTLHDDRIDAVLESDPFIIPEMKRGDRGTYPLARLSDWMIMTPVGPISPRSPGPARIVREHPDTIAEALAAAAGPPR